MVFQFLSVFSLNSWTLKILSSGLWLCSSKLRNFTCFKSFQQFSNTFFRLKVTQGKRGNPKTSKNKYTRFLPSDGTPRNVSGPSWLKIPSKKQKPTWTTPTWLSYQAKKKWAPGSLRPGSVTYQAKKRQHLAQKDIDNQVWVEPAVVEKSKK